MCGILNAMTVDVEDYYHASAFDRVVSRASWDALESRVVANTHRLLDLFNEHQVRGTFFVLGWVAELFPSLVRDIARNGHELASHGHHHQLVYLLTPAQFREDVRRAKATIETAKNDRQSIIISEIPYQVNKASLIEKIADLVREKKLDDISGVNDESDRDGMRIVVDLKRDANASVVLNNLYKLTPMQTTFGIIMLALVDGRPQVLQLKDMLHLFLEHECATRVARDLHD